MDKNALKIAIVVIALLCVAFSIIYLGLNINGGRYHVFGEEKVEYINAHRPIYDSDVGDVLIINPQLTDTLEIEYASMTFEKITAVEERRQNGKNIIRNMKNGWTYKVMLYVQFVGENEGRFYDFVVCKILPPQGAYFLSISFINEELDLNKDVEMKLSVRSETFTMLSWTNESTGVHGNIDLFTKERRGKIT